MRIRWSRWILGSMFGGLFFINFVIGAAVLCLNDSGYIASHLPPKPVDETPPTIVLNGGELMTVAVGGTYEDAGITAYDDRSEVAVTTEGEVNTSEAGEYVIKYTAADERGNSATAERRVKVIQANGTIYLTFDDGPGSYTAQLLDVLAKYGVKATFFVTGFGDDDLIKREYDEGHEVALHTFSHDYAYVYSSVDNFFDDLSRIQERVKNITGNAPTLMRFPGGSSNTVSTRYDGGSHIMSRLTQMVEERGFTYFDWNVTSGDAGNAKTADEVYDRVINALKYGGSSVVLQHDIKGFSVDAVEGIIQYGLENGFVFDKLSSNSFTAHHGVNN